MIQTRLLINSLNLNDLYRGRMVYLSAWLVYLNLRENRQMYILWRSLWIMMKLQKLV